MGPLVVSRYTCIQRSGHGVFDSYLKATRLKDAAGGVYFNLQIRNKDRAAQVIGRQLALIGDQLHRNRAVGPPNRLPSPLRMLRPALTSAIYRDIQKQLWGVQGGLYGAMKAWLATIAPNQGPFRVEALPAWGNVGWINGILLTVALVATASMCTALWVEWEG